VTLKITNDLNVTCTSLHRP